MDYMTLLFGVFIEITWNSIQLLVPSLPRISIFSETVVKRFSVHNTPLPDLLDPSYLSICNCQIV